MGGMILRAILTLETASLFCWGALFSTAIVQAEADIPPENHIVMIEDFISSDVATTLIQFYDREKKILTQTSDNQLSFSSSTDPHILKIISTISNQVLAVMRESYLLHDKKYHVDHCALFARIAGNYCGYHADNVYFDCPQHGTNQSLLRATCDGTCPGAKFVPNHTGWREYTALLYLNDDFEGGEILFEDGPFNRLYQKVIPIKANTLVLAPNGPHFYHEVFPIRSGKRYSLHIWYTSDPRYCHAHIRSE
jgi:2OG-Fe(II) oxygenase superfamily